MTCDAVIGMKALRMVPRLRRILASRLLLSRLLGAEKTLEQGTWRTVMTGRLLLFLPCPVCAPFCVEISQKSLIDLGCPRVLEDACGLIGNATRTGV